RNIAGIAYQYEVERNFTRAVKVYTLAHDLTAISSSLYWLNLAEIYSTPDYTNKDYNKAVEYFKKVIDDPEAEAVHKDNAKTNIKGICSIQKPTICLGLDPKYLQ
ncbi:hypothetical protein KY342_04745, partial [Candidatus Woesearchaeota archaeon]|nr:hypothetical protein [Candidatus Woesearchaeota archaeon]